jgi:hypothetical protein
LAQQVARLESRIQRLRSLDGNGGLNVAKAEAAQQRALDALQRLDNLASAPGLSPVARAQLRMGMAMRNARQALRQAEQNLVQVYNDIDVALNKISSPAEAWRVIDVFRSHTRRLPPLGDRIPIPGDGLGTVAVVVVRGQRFFGVNSSVLSDSSKNLGRQIFDLMQSRGLWSGLENAPRWYGDGVAQILTHAEALALMRAWRACRGNLPAELTLYVDRYTCGNCQQYMPRLMQALGIKKLTIIPKNGEVIPPFVVN